MERVVVTGMGAVSPFGVGVAPLWSGLCAGQDAIRPLDLFDGSKHRTSLAGQIDLDQFNDLVHEPGERRRLTRTDRFAIEAAAEAIAQAGLRDSDALRDAGVFLGSSTGGMLEGEQIFMNAVGGIKGPRARQRLRQLSGQPVCSPADAIVRTFGLHGPVETSATACAAATMSIETALVSLRSGEVDVAITGGSDGLCQLTYGGFNSLRAISPERTRPFRLERDGLNLGEGAGVLLLETESHARARGGFVLAEVAGAGTSCDAHHMTAPHPEGRGASLAMRRALADSGLEPSAIDFINAHGTGTAHNDMAEWRALCKVFGEEHASRLPLTSTKGSVGHLLGACGGLEAIVTVMCLGAGEVHPTAGQGLQDPACPVDLVTGSPRRLERCESALSVNLAFGGANAAVVLRRRGGAT
ncbi:MAG: 3-oxoacyl-[acyl-carrier-protein] synthase II, partial [Candidatus Paceibacteria bacterium]